ncbi:hypothetical protein E2562_038007 [Oryza meyeriana var. granulata]|uniref:phenylalanine--tRNA ligase n=1 Tax=Oryza meyeriana var. granulata TaxID=110450 RepID=A0A6G1F207_9ORYZ|nr:hypothetical protein E2562_038007 [Oryza meyeriana var. granulata]
MPTVSVSRDRFFAALGRTYTQEEFEVLCFAFGIELDDVTTEKAIIRKEKHLDDDGEVDGDDEIIYKIEVAANRYDLLCLEGLARALRVFIGTEATPMYKISSIPCDSVLQMYVKPQEESFRADKLMEFYRSDMKLKKFLHIIENSPVYPVIYDSNRTVLSLPSIINSAHSAITLKTRNVFIECTATDLTKAKIVLNSMVTMFSEYCKNKFEVVPVEVVSHDGTKTIYPDLSCYKMEVSLSEIVGPIGISLDEIQVISLLNKMQLQAESCPSKGEPRISVSVPPTRSDILHARDLVEDVAIAYGYNNVPKSKPKCMTIGGRQPLNRFSDKLRAEVARAGYMEIFEVGDVVTLDGSRDVGASNNRRLAALYCNSQSGFEEIMGLVDRIVKVVRAPHVKFGQNYYVPTNEPEFFPKRQCKIVMSDGKQIGYFGIVHAEVLRKFGIPDPCTFVEIDVEALL